MYIVCFCLQKWQCLSILSSLNYLEKKNPFQVHYGMAEMSVLSGWHSLNKLDLAWMTSCCCSETKLRASQHLFFCFAGAPQREDDHLLSKSNTFSNKNGRIRSMNLELLQHVINESSQETTDSQIFASWRKYRKGTIGINQESKSCLKTNYWWV